MAQQSFSGTVTLRGGLHFVDVPAGVAVSLGGGGHIPVAGTINGRGFHGVVSRAGSDGYRLLLNASARSSLGVSQGSAVEMVLTRDPAGAMPPVPDDLARALEAIAGSMARWEGMDAAHRRELLTWIAEARGSEHRSRRIARTVGRVWD